jgi:hypothetical protein
MAEESLPLNLPEIDRYSQAFSRKMADYFFIDHSYITGKEILKFCDIQQVNLLIIKHLFDKWQGESSKFESPYFHYHHPQVQVALRAFMNVLSQHIQVHKNQFFPLLVSAVQDAFWLILNPIRFYQQEIAKTPVEHLNADYFKQIAKYIQFNKELLKALIQRFERTPVSSTDEALRLLEEVYQENRHYIEPMDWRLKSFSDILSFDLNKIISHNIPSFEAKPSIEEKPLSANWKEVSSESPVIEPIIQPIIEEKISPVIEEKVSIIEEKPIAIVEEKALPVIEEKPITIVEEKISPIIEEKPTISSKPIDDEDDALSDVPNTIHAKYKEENEQTDTVLDKFQQAKIQNLRSAIALNEKFRFINQLFAGDSLEFNNALDKIDACTHLGEALVILKQQYSPKYDWNWETEDVDDFLYLIERRFL